MTSVVTSWRRTLRIVFADVRLLISFYVARVMVWRALVAERKAARKNFRELKRMAGN